jgi:hypothetical protein
MPHPGRCSRPSPGCFAREPFGLFWMLGFPALLLVILGLIPSFREPSADLAGRRVIDPHVPVSVRRAAPGPTRPSSAWWRCGRWP